jgi:hypothetical protein
MLNTGEGKKRKKWVVRCAHQATLGLGEVQDTEVNSHWDNRSKRKFRLDAEWGSVPRRQNDGIQKKGLRRTGIEVEV